MLGIGLDRRWRDLAMVATSCHGRHEAGYASVRVANNLGVVFGPVIGGLLLIGRNWTVFFVGVTVLSLVAIAIGYRFLPRAGVAPTAPPTRRSSAVIRRDTLPALLVSAGLAYLVYAATRRSSRCGGRLVRPRRLPGASS
jgi:MFS family permease